MADQDDLPIGKSMQDFTAEVRATAYFLWEQAGQPAGREDDFWYKASISTSAPAPMRKSWMRSPLPFRDQ